MIPAARSEAIHLNHRAVNVPHRGRNRGHQRGTAKNGPKVTNPQHAPPRGRRVGENDVTAHHATVEAAYAEAN